MLPTRDPLHIGKCTEIESKGIENGISFKQKQEKKVGQQYPTNKLIRQINFKTKAVGHFTMING